MRTTKTKGRITKARAKAMNIKGLRTRRAKKAVKLCDQLMATLQAIGAERLVIGAKSLRHAVQSIYIDRK